MKVNYIGIAAGILALISLALPWWTMTISGTFEMEMEDMKLAGTMSGDFSVYPYDARMTMELFVSNVEEEGGGGKYSESIVDGFSIWYGYVALVLIGIAGVSGIAGSLIVGKNGKVILFAVVILALLSVIIFAAHLPKELPRLTKVTEEETPLRFPEVSLFSSGYFNSTTTVPVEETTEAGKITMGMDYSTYLTFGFWLASVVIIIAFIALLKHPMTKSTKKS